MISGVSHQKNLRQAGSCAAITAVLLVCSSCATVPKQQSEPAPKVDSILVLKHDHRLELISGGKVVRTYKVALGRGGLAAKQREGDLLVPEGHYVIDSRNAYSRFYRALHVSYPNADDRKRATRLGVSPGGAIMIHGLPNGLGWLGSAHLRDDWTRGCIAVNDQEMDEIWKVVPVGTPVEIRP